MILGYHELDCAIILIGGVVNAFAKEMIIRGMTCGAGPEDYLWNIDRINWVDDYSGVFRCGVFVAVVYSLYNITT